MVTTSLGPRINPKTAWADVFERLERACAEGGTSCFSTGTDSGRLTDIIPLALTGGSERVDSIRMTEITTYSEHMDTTRFYSIIWGSGGPVDGDPPMLSSVGIRLAWGGALSMLADALGTPLEDVIDSHEVVATPHDFVFQGRTIGAGTTEALRFEVAGIVAGTKRVVIHHVIRIRAGAAPDWPDANRPGTFPDRRGRIPLHRLRARLPRRGRRRHVRGHGDHRHPRGQLYPRGLPGQVRIAVRVLPA